MVSNATLMLCFSRWPRLPGQAQAGLEYRPHFVMENQLGAEPMECSLGEGPFLNLDAQGHSPANIEVGPGLGLGVSHFVVSLQEQRSGQQAARHTVPSVVGAVEPGEIGVAEQLVPQGGHQTLESALAHMVQVQPVCFPQAPLIRTLSQHSPSSLSLMPPSIAAHPAWDTLRPEF